MTAENTDKTTKKKNIYRFSRLHFRHIIVNIKAESLSIVTMYTNHKDVCRSTAVSRYEPSKFSKFNQRW